MVYSAESCRLVQSVQEVSQELIPDQHATQGVHCCYVDGSFREPSEGGAAYILFDSTGTELEFLQYGLLGCQPYSTFHMEAAALLLEMKAVMFRSLTSLTISYGIGDIPSLLNCAATVTVFHFNACLRTPKWKFHEEHRHPEKGWTWQSSELRRDITLRNITDTNLGSKEEH
ncbi:hypothetical protein FCM35_KLT14092 [Carex littledalei]|uniref:Uncharacterized protein n=1 Tax=Carex littledalei TaxID=544730 RepID=A0A833QLA1_9POAL|nr:hypothetical protein FCM35_KLT14092 [Carex littledalei]